MNKLSIYKPTKNKTGAASQLEMRVQETGNKYQPKELLFFWQISKQKPELDSNGNAQFDWENKITIKLGETDIGKLLLILEAKSNECKLFHQNPKGSTTLSLNRDSEKRTYYLGMGKKVGDGQATRLQHYISPDEAILVREYLLLALKYMWTI